MSINWRVIKDNIFDWVNENALIEPSPELDARKIIWADQSAPQPPEAPYITLKIISGPNEAGNVDELEFDEANDKCFLNGIRSFTLNLQVLGTGSLDIISRLQASLNFPEVSEFFRSKDMTVFDNSGITDVTATLDTVIERRHAIDVMFYTPFKFDTTVVPIETVETPEPC